MLWIPYPVKNTLPSCSCNTEATEGKLLVRKIGGKLDVNPKLLPPSTPGWSSSALPAAQEALQALPYPFSTNYLQALILASPLSSGLYQRHCTWEGPF